MEHQQASTPAIRWHYPGLATFVIGLTVWITSVIITGSTKDTILIPTVIIVGSFTVPVAVIVSVFHREESRVGTGLSIGVMVEGFLLAGMTGLLIAALVETYLLPTKTGTFIMVGLIEETTKAVVLVLIARRIFSREPLDGMVLGAIVGAGFAAFESAGYAFAAYQNYGTHRPFMSLLQTEIDRAELSPFGHILWTAVLGGAIFAAAAGGRRFRLTRRVAGTFVGVVALHALWDQSQGWAIMITRGLTGEGWHIGWPAGVAWRQLPTTHQLDLFSWVLNGMLVLISTVGVLWAVYEWRRYKRQALAGAASVSTGLPTIDSAAEERTGRTPSPAGS
jgi:RsiW-degrading membrane proteinase PrsW (M82 family)